MKRGYRNFVKIYRKKLENVFKIGLKYTVGTVCYIIIDRERIRAEALHCELVRGVKPLFLSVFPRCVVYDIVIYKR